MKKIITILLLISLITITAFGLTGTYTTNGYFYMPGYGEYGTDAFDEYETYMEIADNAIKANKTASGDENIQDTAGAMFTGNTETGLTATYQDGDGTIDVVIGDDDIVQTMLKCVNDPADEDIFTYESQPLDTALTNISALTYVSPSFIKLTADDTYAVRTLAEVKADLSLNNVTNDAQIAKSIGTAQGDLIYFTASATPTVLPKGTASQVLAMNAGATAPEWVAAAGGGNVSTSGTPVQYDYARFVNGTDIEGRSYAEVKTDLAYQLSDMSDVGVTTPTDTYVLVADGDSWESRALVEADISDLGTTAAMVADKLDVFAATTEAELYTVLSDVTQFYEAGDTIAIGDLPTAAVTDGDATHVPTSDNVYDFCETTQDYMQNLEDDTDPDLGAELDAGAHTIGFTLQSTTGDGTTTIDWKLGNKFKFTFGAQNETFTFTAPTNPCTLMLTLIQDGTGSRTVTWPATVKWPGGTAPTLTTTANARDKVALDWDGTQYDGQCAKDFK